MLKLKSNFGLEKWKYEQIARNAIASPAEVFRAAMQPDNEKVVTEVVETIAKVAYESGPEARAGTASHHAIQLETLGRSYTYVIGQEPTDEELDPSLVYVDDEATKRFAISIVDSWHRWCDEWQPRFIASELTLFNTKLGYAGTADVVAEIGELGRGIVDYKTGKKGVYSEAAAQVAGLAHCSEMVIDGQIHPCPPNYDFGLILGIRPNGVKAYYADIEGTGWSDFQARLEVWKADRHYKDAMVEVHGPGGLAGAIGWRRRRAAA